jgi:hypothetical protein
MRRPENYPAVLGFDLEDDSPQRACVLAAARELGLPIVHASETQFEIVVRSVHESYQFGVACSARLAGLN